MGVFDKLFNKKEESSNAASAPNSQEKETILVVSPQPLSEDVETGEAYITDNYSRVFIRYENLPEAPVRGMMAYDEQNFQEAIRLFTMFLDQYNAIVPVLNTRASAYLMIGELDKAEQDLEAAFEIDPEHLLSWQTLARLHRERGDYEKAIEAVTRAIDQGHREPAYNATLYAMRSGLYEKIGETEKYDNDIEKFMEFKRMSGGL